MRDFLKLYGVVLAFALPCGGLALFAEPVDSAVPGVAGWTASRIVICAVAVALLGYAIHRHRTR